MQNNIELDDFVMNKVAKVTTKLIGYTEDCKEISADDPQCYAVLKKEGNKSTYLVKFVEDGLLSGQPVNPYDSLFDKSSLTKGNRGIDMYSFRKVSEESFKNYMKFLKTRSVSWAIIARRLYEASI